MPIQQQVFGLQIPVYDALRMQVVKGERDFGSVELCDRVGEALGKTSVFECGHVLRPK